MAKLLDRGREFILVYPEETVTNSRGTPTKQPSATPVRVRVTTRSDRSQVADLPGQIDTEAVKCIARTAPVGTWARIVYQDKEWDLAVPPRWAAGMTRATRHVEFTIRSRSGLGAERSG